MPETAEKRVFIAEMQPNARFSGAFSLSNAQLGRTRNDKTYLRCLLGDKTATAPGRMWGADETVASRLPIDGFVWVEGETQPYQGELQLIIHKIDPIEPNSDQLRDLLPSAERDPAEMFAEVVALLDTLKHPAAKAIAQEYLADEMLMDQFRTAPAAKMMHHAYIGGLCEHTLSVMKVAEAICPLYPKISRDIVLLGLFLHDLGKTTELSYEGAFAYTDRGELVGHIVEGAIMLHDKARSVMVNQGMRLPSNLITALQHIILSHHGVPEYGAAKLPSSPEAMFVAMIDNLDAKMEIAIVAARSDRQQAFDLGGSFTEKLWALNTRLFKPDPLGS
jgi:3'-5' exoribonuclease